MDSLLVIGIILAAGFAAGEIAEMLRLPKVTGYVLCGVLLNPGIFSVIPDDFVEHTKPVVDLALAFITFSVGGTLAWPRIAKMGKAIVWITILEAEGALLFVFTGFAFVLTGVGAGWDSPLAAAAIPASLLLGCMASPTDPTATLAVIHEYEAEGDVTSTILGVAAFDDVFSIVNFSVAVAVSRVLLSDRSLDFEGSFLPPLGSIVGGVVLGVLFGALLNVATRAIQREGEGTLIVLIFGLLALCHGVATSLSVDPLLATMSFGAVVVNYNRSRDKIFSMLERYTEELIFVFFFTLSGMHLNLRYLEGASFWIALFVVLRTAGKSLGAWAGSVLGDAPKTVRKYAFLGLLPQGGVVIGLALALRYVAGLSELADAVLAVVIGATVVHEILGPIASRAAIRRAGEANKP